MSTERYVSLDKKIVDELIGAIWKYLRANPERPWGDTMTGTLNFNLNTSGGAVDYIQLNTTTDNTAGTTLSFPSAMRFDFGANRRS